MNIFAGGVRVRVKYGGRPGHFATLVEACTINMSGTPAWVIRYDDGMQETQYAHNLEALVSEEKKEDEEVVLKPEKLSAKKGAALPERSRPRLVGGPVVEEVTDDFWLVQLEALKLELDRAKVEAAKWELAYGEGQRANVEFKKDNTALLAENARLRRKLEALERKKR